MTDELSYRMITLLLLVAMKAIRWQTKLKFGGREPESRFHPSIGLDTTMMYVLGLSWSLSVVVYALAPHWIDWAKLNFSDWLRWAGILLGIGSLALLAWSDHHLGVNFSHFLRIRSDHALVQTGPYRWIRHPIYTSGILFFLAMLLASSNWVVGLCWSGVLVLYAYRIPREESMMLDEFGEMYRQYSKTTGRLLPKFHQ